MTNLVKLQQIVLFDYSIEIELLIEKKKITRFKNYKYKTYYENKHICLAEEI